MSVQIFNTTEVQDFLRLATGQDQQGGNPRTKKVLHRILSDLFKAIEDLNVTSDEYWAGIAYLNQLGAREEAGLLSPEHPVCLPYALVRVEKHDEEHERDRQRHFRPDAEPEPEQEQRRQLNSEAEVDRQMPRIGPDIEA